LAKAALALDVLLSVGALAGGAALIIGPRSEILPLPLSALKGSPFDTYFVPGLILFGVLGTGPLFAARLVWLRNRLAPPATVLVGIVLLVWLAVEIAIVGYSDNPPLQPFYLLLGATITIVGLIWQANYRAGDFTRWMYRGGRRNRLAGLLNRVAAALGSSGIGSNRMVTLEVVGRKSGRVISLPLVPATWVGSGTWYRCSGRMSPGCGTCERPEEARSCATEGVRRFGSKRSRPPSAPPS
jgi:hypothetical protein